MATKPLKTLTFEGLNDTYTVPQVDATLSVTGGAADAKVTGDALAEKADKDGVIATAEGLIGGAYTVEKEPYHFRKTAVDLAGRLDETIVGGSLAWNQLCNGSSVTVQSGHKYIAKISGAFSIGASTGTAITGLTSGTDMVIDLTICFGTTIADYIYSLEQASAGAGVNWVRQYIDLDTYHEYCEPTLKSVEGLQSRDVVGFNQWDEEWEVGGLRSGDPIGSDNQIRSKNFCPCLGGETYFARSDKTDGGNQNRYYIGVAWYDSDKNYISLSFFNNMTGDSPNNARFFKIVTNSSTVVYGTTYNHDICINLSDPSKNGTYEPYEKHSYPLDSSVELRGIPKLVTDHIEFDGDEYQSDGQVTRRYGIQLVDASTPLVARSVSAFYFFTAENQHMPVKAWETNVFSNLLPANNRSTTSKDRIQYDGNGDLRIMSNTDGGSFTTIEEFRSWLGQRTLMILYPLATPTTFTAQPYQSPQLVGSTEEYVTTGVVPVGHESRYYEDVVGKVNNLPSDFSTLIAPVEKSFTATRNYTVGSFVIVNNQLYKVSSAISSGGTITPNSNCTATTIMAEILALA